VAGKVKWSRGAALVRSRLGGEVWRRELGGGGYHGDSGVDEKAIQCSARLLQRLRRGRDRVVACEGNCPPAGPAGPASCQAAASRRAGAQRVAGRQQTDGTACQRAS
jgi:hypothetical protein